MRVFFSATADLRRFKASLTLIFSLLVLASPIFSKDTKDVAIMLKAKGSIKIKKTNPALWYKGTPGMHLDSGNIIKSGDNSLAAIVFTDDRSMLKIRSNSEVTIRGERKKFSIAKRLFMSLGEIWVKIKKPKADFLVETPTGVAAVKATEFYLLIDEWGRTVVFGMEGLVKLMNDFGFVLVGKGQMGISSGTDKPTVGPSDPGKTPDWAKGKEEEQQLEFEFQDQNGNRKKLRINYKED